MEAIFDFFRVVSGVLLVFIVPGLAWTYALLGRGSISTLERVGIGLALSVALGSLGLFLLNTLFGIPVDVKTTLVLVLTATGLGTLAALWRKSPGARAAAMTNADPSGDLETLNPAAGKRGVAELVALGLIMGLAFGIGMIPRLDYDYPLHSDEWTHLAEARAIVTTGDIPSYDPVTGEARTHPTTGEVRSSAHEEVGYHLFLAEFKLMTGLPWLTIFRFLPSSIFALTALCAYIFGKRRGFGLEAALLACLVPTTVRFLGPAFAVPVALGLLFVPLVLFLVSHLWAARGLPAVLLILLSFLFIAHAPTALFACLIIVVHGLFHAARSAAAERPDRQRALRQLAAALGVVAFSPLLFLVHNPWVIETTAGESSMPDSLLVVPGGIIPRLGYVPYGLFVLGLGMLAISRRGSDRALLVATVLLATFVFVYYWFGVGSGVLYSRGVLYLSILLLLIAGVATSRIRTWIATWLSPRLAGGGALIAAGLVIGGLLAPSVALGLQSRYEEDYYRRINGEQYEGFTWVRDNLCAGYERALIDPTFGRAFAAITGRHVYAAIPLTVQPVRPPAVDEARETLRDGVPDAAWLRERGLSMVYSTRPVSNPELVQVRDRVYVLPSAEACTAEMMDVVAKPGP